MAVRDVRKSNVKGRLASDNVGLILINSVQNGTLMCITLVAAKWGPAA
jgi:hypothetical protein